MNNFEEDDGDVFVYEEDLYLEEGTQLKDIPVGEFFIFKGERFRKTSDKGWFMGFANVHKVGDKEPGHLHPTTHIQLVH